MRRYQHMLQDVEETVRILRGDRKVPFRLAMGTSAYVRLRQIVDHGADPGLPNAYGAAPRSMLVLSGLPMIVEEQWPPNMWAVLSADGRALQTGILNEGDDRDQ